MSRTKSFVRGFSSTTAQKLLTKGIGILVTPIILTYLNETEYGIWIIIGSLLGYMGLVDFGVTGTTTVLASKKNNKSLEHEINLIINNSFALQCLFGLLMIVIGGVASFYFPNFFELNGYSESQAVVVFFIATVAYGIGMPLKSLKGIIRARQRIATLVWLEFLIFLVTTSINLTLLYYHFGLLSLPLGTIFIRILSFPFILFITKRSYPNLALKFSLIKIKHMKEIFGVSIYWFIGMVAAMVIYSTDSILIGVFLSASLVTSYALTYRLSEVFREFLFSFYFTMMPAIGQLLGQQEKDKVRKLYIKSQCIILAVTIMCASGIYLFNESFISLWVGDKFYSGDEFSLVFASLLLTGVVFQSSSVVLNADLQVKFVTMVRLIEASLNITMSIIFLKLFGLIGLAYATLISSLLTSFWLIPLKTLRLLNISIIDWMRIIGVKLLIVIILNICIVYCSKLSIISLNTTLVIFLSLNLFVFWRLILDSQTQNLFLQKLNLK